MSILVLTLLCVYVLGLYIKLFALYKNIFFMKVIKTKNRFSTTEIRLSKKSGFIIPRHDFNYYDVSVIVIVWKRLYFGSYLLLYSPKSDESQGSSVQ